jgi:hypothetical protein
MDWALNQAMTRIVSILLSAGILTLTPSSPAAEPFEGFLQKHCIACHGPKKSKGDFNQGHFNGYTLDKPGDHYRLCSRPANTGAHMSNLLLLMAQKMGVETDQFGDSNKVISL